MIEYLFLLFFSPLSFYLYKQCSSKFLKKLFLLISIFIPCIIAGMRDINIGTDLKVYVNYQYIITKNFDNFISYISFLQVDFMYGLLTFISSKIIYDFNFHLFIIQLINTICFVKFINSVKFNTDSNLNYALAFFIYLVTFYFKSLNLVRQHLAISFILLFYTYYLKGKNKTAIIFFIISVLFHSSAIIALLIPIILNITKKNNDFNKVSIVILFSTLLISLFGFNWIFKLIIDLGFFKNIATLNAGFLNHSFEFDKIDSFFKIFWIIVFLLLSKTKKDKIYNYSFLICLSFVDIILYEYNIFVMFGDRLALYFTTLIYTSFIPQLFISFKKDNLNKIFFTLVVIIMFFTYFILKYVYQNAGAIYPYASILGG